MKKKLPMVTVFALGIAASVANAAPTAAPGAGALSVYPAEPESPDNGKDYQTCGYFEKSINQEYLGAGHYGHFEMNQGTGDAVVTNCKFPKAPGGKWAKVQKWAKGYLKDEMRTGDVLLIPAGAQWGKYEANDGTFGRSVRARWYSKNHHFGYDACGAIAGTNTVCEFSGSKTARGVNLAHYRVDEAQKAKSAGDKALCMNAAKQAIAISRGLPKFRKDLKASGDWVANATYKTRYDGTLKEDAVFKKLEELGTIAAKLHKECGGDGSPATTEAEENAFKPERGPRW